MGMPLWKIKRLLQFGEQMISGMQMFTDLLTHELAHQWWGNAVTPKSWNDLWLSVGISILYSVSYYFG